MPETFPSTYPSILPSKYIRCLCPSSLPPCKLANDELIDLTRLPIGEYGPWSKQSMKVYSCPGRCLLVRPPKWLLRTSILIILLGILFHIIKSSLIFSSKRSKIGLLFVFLMQKVQLLMLLHRCAEAERRQKPHLILIKNIFWRSASALARPQSQSIEDRRGCYGNGFDCHCYLFPQNRGQSRKDHHSGPTHEF